ncbi:MAG: stage II sporulation protein M [Candidatus Aenigmarchaeota archaeon]|nr:stage II sporulation protein M [Candidatus Aenigmarchaeota archaeon]
MVLERLTDYQLMRKSWRRVFSFGFFVNVVSLVAAGSVFEPAAGLVSLFFVSAVAFPLVNKMFEVEESVDVNGGTDFFGRHTEVLKIYSSFFAGVLLSTTAVYFSMDQTSANAVFGFQLSALKSSAIADRVTGASFSPEIFDAVLGNNLKVAAVSFLLSVIFGAAAVFVIAWNASVIAVFVGILTKSSVVAFSGLGLAAAPVAFFYGLATSVGTIALHGVPEIMSYFVAALAGGIISVGMEKEKLNSGRFGRVVKDGALLFALAVLLIFVAAAVESYSY